MQTSNLNATAIEFVPSLQPLNDPSEIDYKSPFRKGNAKYQNDLISSIKQEAIPQSSPIKSNLHESSPQSVKSRRSASYASTPDRNPIIYAQDIVNYNYYSSDVGPNQMNMTATPSNVQYGYSQYQHVPHPMSHHHGQYVHSYPTQQQQQFPIIEQPQLPSQQQQQVMAMTHPQQPVQQPQYVYCQEPKNDGLVYQYNYEIPQSKQNNHKKINTFYKCEQRRLYSLLNDYIKIFCYISANLQRIILNEAVITFEVMKEIKKIHKTNYRTYCSVINNDYPQLMTSQMKYIKSEKIKWSKLFPSMPYQQDIQDLEAGFKEIAKIKCLNDEILSEIHGMMPWIEESLLMRTKHAKYKSQSHKKMKKKYVRK